MRPLVKTCSSPAETGEEDDEDAIVVDEGEVIALSWFEAALPF